MAISKGSVKGSTHSELIVQPYDPSKEALKRVLYTVSLIVIGFGCLAIGYLSSLTQISLLSDERDHLQIQLDQSVTEISDLRQRVGVLSKGEEISRYAANSVRSTILDLESEVAELQQEVAFYKSIMVPDDRGPGFRIGRVKFDFIDNGKVRFRMVLSQPGNNRSFVSGQLSLVLIASRVDAVVDVPFHEISDDVDVQGLPFKFRYFQDVEGTIELPEDVTPLQIQLVAVTNGKNSQRLEEIIDWPL